MRSPCLANLMPFLVSVSIKYIINIKIVAMTDRSHTLQEVPLPWRQRQPKRALILAEATEFTSLVQTMLKDDGWLTFVPQDASTWLQLVHRHRPSVVICDLDSAGVAALHLAREFKQDSSYQHASFIAVSTGAGPHVVRTATVVGFNYLFEAPMDFKQLASVTAGYGARHGR
ncbi:MAG: response regulator [Rhizobiaceae bacterium]|nr:MAG: response regulator [Rhizobiaceae bacterium]